MAHNGHIAHLMAEKSSLILENLEVLRCRESRLRTNFEFSDNSNLNELMLDYQGINPDGSIEICEDCLSKLKQSELPKFALKNDLYRGRVPDEFSDLTWIEEMACCPKVFHGNTPQDINGSISVVFIGPKKFKADAINKLFRIRRDKVWAFLCWLKFTAQNPFEATTVLPGINDRIIHDDQSNSRQVFEEESAGVDNHPAADLQNTEDGEPVFFLENMGVSDPECDGISGNMATASALQNMFIQKEPNQPDLVFHHSRQAVPEYHNPSLFPGLYPTFFTSPPIAPQAALWAAARCCGAMYGSTMEKIYTGNPDDGNQLRTLVFSRGARQ
ncbi:hypothetical protein B0H13DRAFT_1895258 [Mycena leptocephala]|nr:hypothetical protein B0H13DRAFT_1895258 [Mycena leptocephala]